MKILDFGLAKLAGSEGVTQTGTTVGTVVYMSREQLRGEEVNGAADGHPRKPRSDECLLRRATVASTVGVRYRRRQSD